jgi:hypothetical protein
MKRRMAMALVLLFCVAATVLPGLAAASKAAGPEGSLRVTYYYLPG